MFDFFGYAWVSLALTAALVWVVTPTASAAGGDAQHDRVDPAVRYQTVDNFAASDAWTMQAVGTWSAASKERVADLLFSTEVGIGLSAWRFNVGGGTEPRDVIADPLRTAETFEVGPGQYDWHRQAGQQWFLAAAKRRGVDQFIAFVNSPPQRMTRNGRTNHGDDQTSPANLKPGFEGQYADYLADVLAHFRDDGVVGDPAVKIDFRYLSPVNEPQSWWTGDGQEGSRVDNATILAICRALKPALAHRGLAGTVVTVPESSNFYDVLHPAKQFAKTIPDAYGDYLNLFTSQPDLADLLGHTVCHHLYGSSAGRELRRATGDVGAAMAQHPGWKVWMSEICVMEPRRDLGMTPALKLANMMHACMERESTSAWQWWLAVSNGDFKDGLVYTDWKHPGDAESILPSKMLWAMGNYSRFVRPGYVRVGLTGDAARRQAEQDRATTATRPASSASLAAASTRSSRGREVVPSQGLQGTAYADPRSGRLVVVYVNDGPARAVSIAFADGRAAHRVTAYVTSDAADLAPEPVGDGMVDVPARSVVTVVADPAGGEPQLHRPAPEERR
jgi:O-glycosyl hydrolase